MTVLSVCSLNVNNSLSNHQCWGKKIWQDSGQNVPRWGNFVKFYSRMKFTLLCQFPYPASSNGWNQMLPWVNVTGFQHSWKHFWYCKRILGAIETSCKCNINISVFPLHTKSCGGMFVVFSYLVKEAWLTISIKKKPFLVSLRPALVLRWIVYNN